MVVHGASLRVLFIERLGVAFSEEIVPLTGTPRGVASIPNSSLLLVIEGDVKGGVGSGSEGSDAMVVDGEEKGASRIRLMDTVTGQTRQKLEIEAGRLAVAVEVVTFRIAPPGELFVVVGAVPVSASGKVPKSTGSVGGAGPGGWIYLYRVTRDGLMLAHVTEVEEPPRALRGVPSGRQAAGWGWGEG